LAGSSINAPDKILLATNATALVHGAVRTSAFGQERSLVLFAVGEINVVSVFEFKRYSIVVAMIFMTAAILSAISKVPYLKVPYLYTGIGFATWIFAGHLITIDDDLRAR
jgi:hypothetical protein